MSGPDMSLLTAAIDFGAVTTAVLGAAAALIVVYIAWKSAKMVIAAVKGGSDGYSSDDPDAFDGHSKEDYGIK